jgi:glycosyltransferase involved in cell wall biosynthesis
MRQAAQQLQAIFQPEWYLQTYPDVAAAGIDPWQHFISHGYSEGRYPCALPAFTLEQQLWCGADTEKTLAALQQLMAEQHSLDAVLSAWVLARWYSSWGQWGETLPFLPLFIQHHAALQLIGHPGPFILAFQAYYHCRQSQQAAALLSHPQWPDSPDKQLLRSMLLSGRAKIAALNRIFNTADLAKLSRFSAASLDKLKVKTPLWGWRKQRGPTVSVIIPCFNAAATLSTALRALQQQSWQNLEILVSDDASTDNSVAVVRRFMAKDPRIHLLTTETNQGAYTARNRALAVATGDYITTHDSDDWSHPEKIALQVKAIRDSGSQASVSHWVRCSVNLDFQRWRTEDTLVYRNVSSLMFSRAVFLQLGYWDRVSVNADTEYYYRILAKFGAQAITEVLPGVPLAFGRADPHSLSQTKNTHLRTQFRGLRKNYHDAAQRWHQQATSLYLPEQPDLRPFPAPPQMLRGSAAERQHNLQLAVQQAAWFDAIWYRQRYPDLTAWQDDPALHFILHGAEEWRDPSPQFSFSGYACQMQLTAAQALHQLLAHPENIPQGPLCYLGNLSVKAEAPVLMVVAHQATENIFGAERSLLDVLQMLSTQQLNLLVVTPGMQNPAYLAELKRYCQQLVMLPYQWWHANRQADAEVITQFQTIMQQHQVARLYINTLVLYEPLLAARALHLPVTVHVRELPEHDPALCETLGASAAQIRDFVLFHADTFIANSQTVARYLAVPERCCVVPNSIDLAQWPLLPPTNKPRLQVALISSNLPKKGLFDAVELARLCSEQGIAADILLFGPQNHYIQELQQQSLPENLFFCGYQASAQAAIAQADIVLNLSHFQESFGRTVLEAMAAGRVVITYDWGALTELVATGCGVLVPYQDVTAVAAALAQLSHQPQLRQTIIRRAREHVEKNFTADHIVSALLSGIFSDNQT